MLLRQIPQLLLPVYLAAFTTVIVFAQVGRTIGGDLLAYGAHSGVWQLYVVDMNTGLQVNVVSSDADDKQPAWSDDGRLAFVSNRDGDSDIYIYDFDTGEITQVTHNDVNDIFPSWLPDGRIAYTSERNGNADIYIIDPESGVEVNVTDDPDSSDIYPSWLPGERIGYVSQGLRNTNHGIYVRTLATGEVTRLVNWGDYPAWSADGRLAFTVARGERSELYIKDGDAVNNATRQPAYYFFPAWSADGRRLAFMSDRDGGSQDIYLLDTESGDVINLTRDEARNCCPAWTK